MGLFLGYGETLTYPYNVSDPAINAVLAVSAALPAGLYEVTNNFAHWGVTVIGDYFNTEIRVSGVSKTALYTPNNIVQTVYVRVTANQTISIAMKAAGSAGTIYTGVLSLTRVGA